MAYGRRAQWEEIRTRAASTFNGSYQTLGSVLAHPAVLLKIINNSSVDVTISLDGSTDQIFIPDGTFTLYDINTNHQDENIFAAAAGTQFYVKGANGTGSVYLEVVYSYRV